jgi:cation diffusion facilitator CzcD-associated flavoprotein CzcO
MKGLHGALRSLPVLLHGLIYTKLSDIPAISYSFSFAPNIISSRVMATHSELRDYVDGVVDKYRLLPLMTLRTECESASWDSSRQRWSVQLRDLETGERYVHECKVLFSAVGMLSVPSEPKIPGRDTFKGSIVHTGRWTEDVELEGKNTVVLGNGCAYALDLTLKCCNDLSGNFTLIYFQVLAARSYRILCLIPRP